MRAADLVYVNTVVVLDYLLAARAFRRKTLVHVHEIPDGLKLQVFRRLLKWTRADVIFNSKATRAAYRLPAQHTQHVVYNGIAAPAPAEPADYDGTRPLRLLMLGRISRIKGQDLLIECSGLAADGDRAAPGGAHRRRLRSRTTSRAKPRLREAVRARRSRLGRAFRAVPGGYRAALPLGRRRGGALAPAGVARPRGDRGDGVWPPAAGGADRRPARDRGGWRHRLGRAAE